MNTFRTFQLVFTVSCMIYNSYFRVVWQNLPADMDTYCPDVYSNSTRAIKDTEGLRRTSAVFICCYDCRCAKFCATTRNCSFPETYPNWNKECLVPASGQLDNRIQSYNMVSKNPRDGCKNGMILDRQCGEIIEENIGNLYPISSRMNRIIYKNPTCARCYDEVDLLPWDMKYICPNENYYPGESVTVDIDSLNELCHIEFSHPLEDNSDVIKDECVPNEFLSCLPGSFSTDQGHFMNNTNYNDFLCLRGFVSNIKTMAQDNWYDPMIIFKNTYFSACTSDNQFLYEKSCLTSDANMLNKISFSSIMDVSVLKSAAKMSSRSKCGTVAEYPGIIVKGVCCDILCPLGQMRLPNGSCKHFTTYWDSAIRRAFIKLTHDGRNDTCSVDRDLITVQLTKENQWLFPWIVYKVFSETTVNTVGERIVFIVELHWIRYSDLKTPTESFLKHFRNSLSKEFPLMINGENVIFKQSFSSYRPIKCKRKGRGVTYHPHWAVTISCDVINYSSHNISVPNLEWVNVTGIKYGRTPSLTVSNMMFCNNIVIQAHEYSELPDKQLIYLHSNQRYISSEEYVKYTGMNEKKTIKVCLSDLDLSALERSNSPIFHQFSVVMSLLWYLLVSFHFTNV